MSTRKFNIRDNVDLFMLYILAKSLAFGHDLKCTACGSD